MPKDSKKKQTSPGTLDSDFLGGFEVKKGKKKKKQKETLLQPGLQECQPGTSHLSGVQHFYQGPPPNAIVAHNPFDDQGHGPGPQPMSAGFPMQQRMPGVPFSMHNKHPGAGPPMPTHPGSGKIYPSNQPMVFNPSNPNAPPIYPCGVCHKEVHDNDQAILCESGCNFWFHRGCTGLTEPAYHMLTQEVYAEWVCNQCLATKNIPMVKMKP